MKHLEFWGLVMIPVLLVIYLLVEHFRSQRKLKKEKERQSKILKSARSSVSRNPPYKTHSPSEHKKSVEEWKRERNTSDDYIYVPSPVDSPSTSDITTGAAVFGGFAGGHFGGGGGD